MYVRTYVYMYVCMYSNALTIYDRWVKKILLQGRNNHGNRRTKLIYSNTNWLSIASKQKRPCWSGYESGTEIQRLGGGVRIGLFGS